MYLRMKQFLCDQPMTLKLKLVKLTQLEIHSMIKGFSNQNKYRSLQKKPVLKNSMKDIYQILVNSQDKIIKKVRSTLKLSKPLSDALLNSYNKVNIS